MKTALWIIAAIVAIPWIIYYLACMIEKIGTVLK